MWIPACTGMIARRSGNGFVEELLHHRGKLGIVDQKCIVTIDRIDRAKFDIGTGIAHQVGNFPLLA